MAVSRPQKPYKDYPLYPHSSGQWAKTIKGQKVYFGPWEDPDAALGRYMRHVAGMPQRPMEVVQPDSVTLEELIHSWLGSKKLSVEAGELSARTYASYLEHAKLFERAVIKQQIVYLMQPSDFAAIRARLAAGVGPRTLEVRMTVFRGIFKWGYEIAGLLPTMPRFGGALKKPPARAIRAARYAAGMRMWKANEIRAILDKANVHCRAFIYFGINAGFEAHDVSGLTNLMVLPILNNETTVLEFPRPKTAIRRSCPLWPETIKALRDSIAQRPTPRLISAEDKVFVTKFGRAYGNELHSKPVSNLFFATAVAAGLRRDNVGFLGLRHSFRTIADEVPDRPAVDRIMGHLDKYMGEAYREHISVVRLEAVVNHVRDWLLNA